MSIEYRLTLAGQLALEDMAHWSHPMPVRTGRPRVTGCSGPGNTTTSDTSSRSCRGIAGYCHGGTLWAWEPDNWVDIDFHMRKTLIDEGVPNVLATVAKVLAERTKDAALVINGTTVLLTRVAGTLRQHNAAE